MSRFKAVAGITDLATKERAKDIVRALINCHNDS